MPPVRECGRIPADRVVKVLQRGPTTDRSGSCRLAVFRGIDMEPWREIVLHGRACGQRYLLTAKANSPTLLGPLHEDHHRVAEERSNHQDRSQHSRIWPESPNMG